MSATRPPGPHADLEALARRGRWLVLSTVAASGAGHVGGPLSAMDLWVALYFRVLDVRPDEPAWPGRDRFILSKGESAPNEFLLDKHGLSAPRVAARVASELSREIRA